MRFIWWGNAFSIPELKKGYQTIKVWWVLTILCFIVSRIAAFKYKEAVYADAFIIATCFYLLLYALNIHLLILTFRLVKNINKNENTPPVYIQVSETN